MSALAIAKVVDALDVVADGEDAAPAGDGVCADDWGDGGEDFAHVVGGAAGLGVDLESVEIGRLVEGWLGVL